MKKKKSYQKQHKNAKGKNHSFTARPPIHYMHSHPRRTARHEQIVEGIFQKTTHGYGFVANPDGKDDIFIGRSSTMNALDGDLVRIAFHTERGRGEEQKTSGRVLKIVEERDPYIVGTVADISHLDMHYYRAPARRRTDETAPVFVLIPDNRRLDIRPIIKGEGLHLGDKVLALLTDRPYGESSLCHCRLVTNFGPVESRDANYMAILAELGVPTEFPQDALEEAEALSRIPLSSKGRVRRRETIFTIDGADAKDLDDAVSISRLPGGAFRLGVHIADVSAYVLPHTALDRAVMERGTSLYFVDRVVPMLPPALSNGACSLGAGEDKYTLSAIIDVNKNGEIVDVKLEKSIIRSTVRGVYHEVNDLLANAENSPYYNKYQKVYRALLLMKKLYHTVHESRRQGMLELDRPEPKIKLNEEGHPVEILRRERGLAERMIEECMLLANEAVARTLHQRGYPCVYRVHGAPDEEKVDSFVRFAYNRGLDTSAFKPPYSSMQFNQLLTAAKQAGIAEPFSYLLLRTMDKARYSELPSSHFGIGLPLYCHFTSPIRRLSDLATHRIISEMLAKPNEQSRLGGYAKRAADAATQTELRALQAERRIEALYKTIYLADRIGESYPALISSVTSFGIFAELENTCEGLIPIETLGYRAVFDEEYRQITVGSHIYQIGDAITVRVEETDIAASKVTFSLQDTTDKEEKEKTPSLQRPKKSVPYRPSRPKKIGKRR